MTTAAPRTLDITPLMNARLKTTVEIPDELKILEESEQPAAGHGTFRILHQQFGDKRITWDARILKEINAAKKLFLDLVKQGLTPYRVGVNGQKTSVAMSEFDPSAEEVIFVPMAMVAGG